MSIANPTEFTTLSVGGVSYTDDVLRFESWRSVNSVGVWQLTLRNIDGEFNNTFDVQDELLLSVNGATLMQGRVDGPAVTLLGSDTTSIWDEYVILGGYDRGQDLLFHNDFEYLYPNHAQLLNTVLNDIFDTQLVASTNITYANFGGTPAIGGIEFRHGGNFIATLQEMFQRADYLFYVDDALAMQIGDETAGVSATGVTVTSERDNADNNIIGDVEFKRRDGGKLYNQIWVWGKRPQFDAYTEYTADRWGTVNAGWTVTDDTAVKAQIVGNTASVKMFKAAPAAAFQGFTLDFSQVGQDEVDMSDGEIGFWWYYDGGTSINRACARVSLLDDNANQIYFFSGNSLPGGGVASQVNSTRCIQGEWGWCTAPVGRDEDPAAPFIPDTWINYPVGGFNWDKITDMSIGYQTTGADTPTTMYIDGLKLPFAALGFAENAASKAAYRTRPLIVNAPFHRHQVTLEGMAEQLLAHHKDTGIDLIKLTTVGNQSIRYAGQSITVDIPALGLNTDLFYLASIHHIIEPYTDVSNGYGFDWVTEIEAIPVNTLAYDMGRIGLGGLYSAMQVGTGSGVGQTLK